MDFTKVRIETTQQGLDLLCAQLLDIGMTGFELEDPGEFSEFLNQEDKNWDYIEDTLLQKSEETPAVIVYLPKNEQGKQWFKDITNLTEQLKEDRFTDYGSLRIYTAGIQEQDWAHNWKKYFKPFQVGQNFLVKPTWEEVENKESRKVIEIDPGSSFGTGQHHTTKMCLEALETVCCENKRVLDMGCGSGILSLGCLLLGTKEVVGVDIDKLSVDISRENVAKNGFGEQFTTYCTDILQNNKLRESFAKKPFDIVLANIVADVIIAQAKMFFASLKPGGTLITSGIIANRKLEVKKALQEVGFIFKEEKESKEWICFVLTK